MMKIRLYTLLVLLAIGFVACDDTEPIPVIPPSDGDVIEAEVGGADQPNQVYIDLSSATTTVVSRGTWDLAFFTGDDFNVTLNYSAYMSARATESTDLTEVSSNLVTEEYKAEMATGPECPVEWVDDPSGDLSNTAIGEVAADANMNYVFVVNRGYLENGSEGIERGHVKVKFTRDGDNYVVTYGDIDATTFNSVTITKDNKYNAIFFSFDNGIVSVEPEKKMWDIVMTTATLQTPDNEMNMVPYNFKDISLSNQANMKISAVEVTDETTYDSFSLSDASMLTIESNRTGIGSSWRGLDFNTFQYYVKDNIFYVIEDPDGNQYKLKFTRMHCIDAECTGERGYPELVYELLKDE